MLIGIAFIVIWFLSGALSFIFFATKDVDIRASDLIIVFVFGLMGFLSVISLSFVALVFWAEENAQRKWGNTVIFKRRGRK